MIIGHAGIAVYARGFRKRGPDIRMLLIVAYMPDILRAAMGTLTSIDTANAVSHSIPAVLVQALCLGAISFLWSRDIGAALVIASVVALHWPADIVTACKPTWPGGPQIGLALYRRPFFDFLIEMAIAMIALRSWPSEGDRFARPKLARRIGLVSLAVIQVAVLGRMAATSTIRFAGQDWQWTPRKGLARFRPMRVEPPVCLE